MKKLLIVILSLLMLTGCAVSSRLRKSTAQKIVTMFENKESFMLLIARDDCETCKEYKEILKDFCKDNDISVYYISSSKPMTNDDDMNNLINNYLYYLETVPTTYFILNGVVSEFQEGLLEKDELVDWLGMHGYTK